MVWKGGRAKKRNHEQDEKRFLFFQFSTSFSLTNKIYGWILKNVHMLRNLLESKAFPTFFSSCLSLSLSLISRILYLSFPWDALHILWYFIESYSTTTQHDKKNVAHWKKGKMLSLFLSFFSVKNAFRLTMAVAWICEKT